MVTVQYTSQFLPYCNHLVGKTICKPVMDLIQGLLVMLRTWGG